MIVVPITSTVLDYHAVDMSMHRIEMHREREIKWIYRDGEKVKGNKSRRKRGKNRGRKGHEATKKENRIIWPDIRSVEYLTSCPDAWISGECIVVATPPLIRKLAFFHLPSATPLPLLPPSDNPTVGHSPFLSLFFPSLPLPSLVFESPKFEARKERTCLSPRSIDKYQEARRGEVRGVAAGFSLVARGGRMGNFTAAKCFTARINAGGSMTTTGETGTKLNSTLFNGRPGHADNLLTAHEP